MPLENCWCGHRFIEHNKRHPAPCNFCDCQEYRIPLLVAWGRSLEGVVEESIRIANRECFSVEWQFNQIQMTTRPGSDAELVIARYRGAKAERDLAEGSNASS